MAAPPRRTIRVLIADDHKTFSDALKTTIDLEKGLKVTGVVNDGRDAVEIAGKDHPDVVLIDVEMPGMDGIAATREIKIANPETQVVILSAHEDDTLVARAVEAGATGYLSKLQPVADVASAIRAAAKGEALIPPDEVRRILRHLRSRREEDASARARVNRLTGRETQILQLMADGNPTEDIASALNISRHTLRTHVQNILMKLGVHSKLEALAEAIRYGRVTVGDPRG